MSYNLPKPSPASLLLQSIAVIAFVCSLYLFVTAFQTNSRYNVALKQLQERKLQLNQAYKQVDTYMKFIDTNPYYQKNLGEPQWEKVDETWVGLPYDQLLRRFSSLYREDRPFILDYFQASLSNDNKESAVVSQGAVGNDMNQDNEIGKEKENKKLIFHLQGYYLCPCQ